MRIYRLVSTAIGGVFMASISTAAFAGCGYGAPVQNCNPNVIAHTVALDAPAPIHTYGQLPYGYLKTFNYKNSQNVNIMRLHSRAPFVALADRPRQFTSGCTPTSTVYCRAPQGRPVNIAPAPAPAPIAMPYVAPAPRPHVNVTNSGYNASAYASRQYGSLDFVPGTAHIPTSIIDRSPITHIDGVPQPQISSVTTGAYANSNTYASSHSYASSAPRFAAPNVDANVIGHVVSGQHTYQPESGGAYWEKTSGPAIVDGLPATQILCRREAPRPAPVTVQVVRPVIGVPMPVPTPVPVPVSAPMCNGFQAPVLAGAATHAPRHGHNAPKTGSNRYGSRWTY